MGKLFEELKRRKVFRVAAVYAVDAKQGDSREIRFVE